MRQNPGLGFQLPEPEPHLQSARVSTEASVNLSNLTELNQRQWHPVHRGKRGGGGESWQGRQDHVQRSLPPISPRSQVLAVSGQERRCLGGASCPLLALVSSDERREGLVFCVCTGTQE